MVRTRALSALTFLLAASAAAPAAEPAWPHLTTWVVVRPPAPRVEALEASLPARPGSGSPGLLLELPAPSYADPSAAEAVRRLVASARRAGWRSGVALELPEVPVPTDGRSAEAATAATLVPGLGPILVAARGADLFALDFPEIGEDLAARRFVLKKVAAAIRAENPRTWIAAVFHQPREGSLFPAAAAELKTDDVAPFVDLVGLHLSSASADPAALRAEADAFAFGRPLFVELPEQPGPEALLHQAARFASAGSPVVVAPLSSAAVEDRLLSRFGGLLSSGDYARDGRPAEAGGATGEALALHRLAPDDDLGGLVLLPGLDEAGNRYRGAVTLTLDAPSYAAAEVVELATGRSKRFEIPATKEPPRLSLSLRSGAVAVRLDAREKPPEELTRAAVGVTAKRWPTVEEILARHQVWRARRDARWKRFAAWNKTSIRFRIAELANTFEQTLAGPFFYEPGKGYDWAWSETYFNGVKWRGKSSPVLPIVQPEKVSELPLEITFNDAYRYALEGEDTVLDRPAWVLTFEPKATESEKALFAGTVWIDRQDDSVLRVKSRQLNLKGEVQSVDETTDFLVLPGASGDVAMRFPLLVKAQWILRTFSRTTVLERETVLSDVRLDPETFDAEKKALFASPQTMVRDTEKGVRYLEKTPEGDRKVTDETKLSRFFGLGGVFYDESLDYPLPLLGVYYLDLDVKKKGQQAQVFFGGVLLAGSFNEPKLFGSTVDLGADVFGIAVRGTDVPYQDGEKVDAEAVKSRSFAANLNVGTPVGRHVKLSGTVGVSYRDYAEADDTDPAFAIPSDHWVYRLEGRAAWDWQGWALSGRYGWNKRSRWDAWGYAGNPEWDLGKDTFRTWGVQLAKDFHLPKFQRVKTAVNWLGTSNADRFSKISFGFFGSSSLRGFSSGSLRGEEALIGRLSYGFVVGDVFRLEALYDQAWVTDEPSGFSWTPFGGAGISGQFSGPWSTLVQLDAGLPVVGRDRGQTGFVLSLNFLKIF